MAMAALQADPKTTMMIGDSQYDILSAKQAGAVSVGVAWSLKGEAHLRSFEPNYIIQNMLELLELVETEL
jgi:pyrophosphatase PpaX